MKGLTKLLLLLLLPLSISWADVESDVYHTEYMQIPPSQGPVTLRMSGDAIFKSNFNKSGFRNDRIGFGKADADIDLVYYYTPWCCEGANVTLSYHYYKLDWDENPDFDKKDFYDISLSLGFATKRLESWLWKAQVTANTDPQKWDFNHYTTFDLVLWGRYDWCCNKGLHFGFYGLYGMKVDRIYPIIGFDWDYSCRWKFNVVFPVNISAVYSLTNNWKFLIAHRTFDIRHRVGRNEEVERAIWEYRNHGVELAINYDSLPCISLNVHAGATFGGKLKLSNAHHKDATHYKFNSAFYCGAEGFYNF